MKVCTECNALVLEEFTAGHSEWHRTLMKAILVAANVIDGTDEMTMVSDNGTKSVPMLRNSERSDFKRCVLRWHWRYNEHLVPIDFNVGPLVFGSLGHIALAEYYPPGLKRGPHPAETWDEITKDLIDFVKVESKYFDDEIEATWEDAKALGHDMLVNYVDHYHGDQQWHVLWTEDQFHQLIPHPSKPEPIVNYVGTIDLVVRNLETGRIEYVDHKFMKTIETEHLYIDNQNGGYLTIGTHELRKRGVIGPKEVVRVLVYNFLRKAKHDTRPQNKFGEYLNKDGTVSKKQPSRYFHRERIERVAAERNTQIKRIAQEAYWMKAVRAGLLPITKTPMDRCRWDCKFFDLCNIHEAQEDIEYAKEALFNKEDPYAEYRGETQPKTLAGHQLLLGR